MTDGAIPLDEARRRMADERSSPAATSTVNAAEAAEETYFETIRRLAALPIHEYERCRKPEAERNK